MKTVAQLTAEILAREGGFVNDPDDPGGATNHGVTIGTMRALGVDINGDGRIDVTDVKILPVARAAEIYMQHYFYKPGIDKLPVPLQGVVFDMHVNAGANAIKLLQRFLTGLGFPCGVDGEVGRQTIYAAELAYKSQGAEIADLYAIARRNYYYSLADSRPASRKYARRKDGGKGGWIIRAEDFMRPDLRLTDAQHRARVENWP
jgi:lysozyme family protein